MVEVGESAARTVAEGTEHTYIPEDKVGDIHVYLDDLRLLRASWKGVNLLHKWGECYSPVSWGFRKGRTQPNVFQPDNLADVITVHLVPDVPVRVSRTAQGVGYLWSFSWLQSEFTADDVANLSYPRRRTLNHLQSDVKQVNRLEVTQDRLVLTTTLKFLSPPSRNVIFYPVLFPGTGRDRKYMPERRILGRPCTVLSKRGEARTVVYPEERQPSVWLDGEPRSLAFDLENLGKVRYDFNFSDPNVSLLFYAHTGWPTPSLNPYCCPAIVGKLVIPAKDGFKNGSYECTVRMEVVVGEAAKAAPNVASVPKPSPLDKPLDLRIATATPSFRFFADDPLQFHLVVDGLKTDVRRDVAVGQVSIPATPGPQPKEAAAMESRPTTDERRELAVEARVLNYENQEAHRQRLPVDITKPLTLSVPPIGKGAFILEAKLLEGGEVVGAKAQRFSVMDRPVEYPADKSFFGCTNGFMRFPGKSLDDVKETASLLHDIGIKKLRWNEHWTVDWAMVEKEPGRYVFPERFDKLESVKALGMDNFIAMGTFEGARCVPEWAKSGRKTLYDYDIPKDLTAYENYCFEVAKRFKGLVKEFELENEPNYVRPENPQQAQDYIETKAAIL
ncbi:MAG: hypothetical protein FJ272_17505, partial [Planctomycetes bacterium]|nr:hypothetical protein [Planctomycetota bacterium]